MSEILTVGSLGRFRMVDTLQKGWMDKLKALVYDDKKVLTYKWVSREFEVHVNTAKRMLFALTEETSGDQNQLDVLYLIAGRAKDMPGIHVKIVADADVAGFDQVTSKHVYAISAPGLATVSGVFSSDIIAGSDAKAPTSKYAAIGNKKSIIRPNVEVQPEPKVKAEPSKEKTTKPVPEISKIKAEPEPEQKTKPQKATKAPQTGKNSLKGMFAKAAAVKAESKAEPKAESKAKSTSEDSPGKENVVNKDKDTSSRKRPKKATDRSGNKRRRIQVMSDSESSEDDNEDASEEVAAPPQAELIQSDSEDDVVPATPQENPKKHHRVKKRVTKTYVDESGFLCTKQEMQSCSESDQDEPVVPKKEPEKIKEPKAKPAVKSNNSATNKQASIMSFFKKK